MCADRVGAARTNRLFSREAFASLQGRRLCNDLSGHQLDAGADEVRNLVNPRGCLVEPIVRAGLTGGEGDRGRAQQRGGKTPNTQTNLHVSLFLLGRTVPRGGKAFVPKEQPGTKLRPPPPGNR